MPDNLPLILVVVAVLAALTYVLFLRKKALPANEAGAKASPAKVEAAPRPKGERHLGPTPTKPAAIESLPSTDVLPDESTSMPAIAEATSAAPPVASKKDVAGLRKGLAATRGGFMARLKALFVGKKEIDPAILEQMEEVMIGSDVGVKTTQAILERLREKLAKNELSDSDAVWAALRAEATRILDVGQQSPSSARDGKH